MQRSKSFTSIAFEQKRKAIARKSSPQRQSRPKPEWNDYLTDPNRFKVSEEDLLKKKRLLVSKNNILAPEYQPPSVRSAMATPRRSESSQSTPRKTPREEHRRTQEASSPAAAQRQDRVSSLDLLRESQSLADDDTSSDKSHNDFDSDRDEDVESAFERHSAHVEEVSMAHLDSDEDVPTRKSSKSSKMMSHRLRTAREHHHHQIESGVTSTSSRPTTTWGSVSRALTSSSPVNKRVGKPTHSKAASSPSTAAAAAASIPPPQTSTPTTPVSHHTAKFIERSDRIGDDDLLDIARNIDHLQQELRMYEEIAGKKSILDAEELQLILGTDDHGTMNVDTLNQKTVIRYLVSLVCQTMTYTLQSEVKQHHLESEMALMQSKMDDVLRLVQLQQQQQTAASYSSRYGLSAPPMVTSLPVSSPPPPPPRAMASSSRLEEETEEDNEEEHWLTAATPAAAAAATPVPPPPATPLASSTPFYGTSTSDWLFMHNSPAAAAAAASTPAKAASMAYVATPPMRQPKTAVAAGNASPEAFQTPNHEYNLSPETAADLACRTYDMYVAQQPPQRRPGAATTMPSSSSSSSLSRAESVLGELDHYDEMIDRLSYQFSSTKAAKYTTGGSTGTPTSTFTSDGISIVVPHATAPTPAKPSPHPFQGTTTTTASYTRSGNTLFPASPPTAKKIYDASLGNYSLIDTYDS